MRIEGGRFSSVEGPHFEPTDRFELSADDTRIDFVVESRNYPSTPRQQETWRVDEDKSRFRASPPGALITVEHLEGPGPYIGPRRSAVDPLPFPFRGTDPTLAVLEPRARVGPRPDGRGAYLTSVPVPESVDLEDLSEEMRDRLRALGYLGD